MMLSPHLALSSSMIASADDGDRATIMAPHTSAMPIRQDHEYVEMKSTVLDKRATVAMVCTSKGQ